MEYLQKQFVIITSWPSINVKHGLEPVKHGFA